MQMRKGLLTLLLPTLLAGPLLAQDKGYIGFDLGGSLPMGNLASKSPTNDDAGYASGGAVFDITFAYRLGGHFGIAGLLRGTAHQVDAQAMADDMVNGTGQVLKLEAGTWGLGALMAGGYGTWSISERTSFEAKALLGFGQASSPTLKLSSGSWTIADQDAGSASVLTYAIGAGLRFNVGRRLCLLTGVDYMGSDRAKFKDVRVDANGTVERTSFEQPYSMLNIAVGLGFRL